MVGSGLIACAECCLAVCCSARDLDREVALLRRMTQNCIQLRDDDIHHRESLPPVLCSLRARCARRLRVVLLVDGLPPLIGQLQQYRLHKCVHELIILDEITGVCAVERV